MLCLQSCNGKLCVCESQCLFDSLNRLYYTKITIGSPPVDYHVQVDTGSDILWVNCHNCDRCPTKSDLHVCLALSSFLLLFIFLDASLMKSEDCVDTVLSVFPVQHSALLTASFFFSRKTATCLFFNPPDRIKTVWLGGFLQWKGGHLWSRFLWCCIQ